MAMQLMKLCFLDQIWDGNGISRCFSDIYPFFREVCVILMLKVKTAAVIFIILHGLYFLTRLTMLGFGASMVTFVIIVVLVITERTTRGRRKVTSVLLLDLIWWIDSSALSLKTMYICFLFN